MIHCYQVDAFTDRPYEGNPAAVCLLGERKPCEEIRQRIATEMNLSATAFVERRDSEATSSTSDAPTEPVFGLRWFTPTTEIDLCGHATLASAHVLWERDELDADRRAVFDTASGRLTARRDPDGWIWMDFPSEPPRAEPAPPALDDVLDASPIRVGRTPRDLFTVLDREADVRSLRPDLAAVAELNVRGLIVTARAAHPGESSYDFVSRFFAPGAGVPEDPVTGSAHCTLGPYWADQLQTDHLVGYQASARGGFVRARVGSERVELGGLAVTTLTGTLSNVPL